jgi:hypothetical protein
MSKVYRLNERPANWSSAHDSIRYVFDLPTENIIFVGDTDGYAGILLAGHFMGTSNVLSAGDLIYIDTAPYIGVHVVKEVDPTGLPFYILETKYISTITLTGKAKFATTQEWFLYTGLTTAEKFDGREYDYKLSGVLNMVCGVDGFMTIDVAKFVASSFDLPTPMLDSIDLQSDLSYNLINAYRLCRPTAYDFIGYALNSSITSEDLNAKYIGQYKALKEVDNVIYSNAMNFASIFTPFNELKSYYVKPIVDTSLDSDSFKSDFININK